MCNIQVKPGRIIRYPSFVDLNKIISTGSNGYRFSLTIPFLKNPITNKKYLAVILKNPSSANAQNCDTTISKVCHVAYFNGYCGVVVFNVFPYRASNAKAVVNFYSNKNYKSIMAINLQYILNGCSGKDVAFAWGTNTIGSRKRFPGYYDNAISNITNAVTQNSYFVEYCTCKATKCLNASYTQHSSVRYPLHALRWSNNSILIRY